MKTVILQSPDGACLVEIANELSTFEARWLLDRLNPALAALQLQNCLDKGIFAVIIPERIEENL